MQLLGTVSQDGDYGVLATGGAQVTLTGGTLVLASYVRTLNGALLCAWGEGTAIKAEGVTLLSAVAATHTQVADGASVQLLGCSLLCTEGMPGPTDVYPAAAMATAAPSQPNPPVRRSGVGSSQAVRVYHGCHAILVGHRGGSWLA